MTRYAKRTDANQKEIVSALRLNGYTVEVTSHIGNGFPDILISKNSIALGVEIKDIGKRADLTDDEIKMKSWFIALGMNYTVSESLYDIESAYYETKKRKTLSKLKKNS